VLISGSGTNLQALLDSPDPAVEPAVVVSDRAEAGGLRRAREAGLAVEVVPWVPDRAGATAALCRVLERHRVELVVLAGFMRILGSEAIDRYRGRIVNIHPSLLPSFPGGRAVEAALEHGVKVTGCTVHFVDEQVDHGQIIAQVPVEVLADDTVESLHRRIQRAEHSLYPGVVAALCRGTLPASTAVTV
jgi:phosphoribosylglycinamide formyltransferase-1